MNDFPRVQELKRQILNTSKSLNEICINMKLDVDTAKSWLMNLCLNDNEKVVILKWLVDNLKR